MSAENRWLTYAQENLEAAKLCLANGLYNTCLQNAQQAVEKALKAVIIKHNLPFSKTHSTDILHSVLTNPVEILSSRKHKQT